MNPNLFHIYGPLYINSYGLAIAIGIIVFCYLIQKNNTFKKIISFDQFKSVMLWSVAIGVVGGRLLWAIEEWHLIKSFWEIFAIWEPGYSFLGTLIAILIFIPIYLKKINVPNLLFLDTVAIYTPLMHSIARIGCLAAGCCHGIPTNNAWGIVYTHPNVAVPNSLKFIKLHPTQIYTSICLLFLFLAMYFIFQYKFKKPGQLAAIYLIFTSLERFTNDFFRADRDFYNLPILNVFSSHQWLSLLICLIGLLILAQITFRIFTFKKYTPTHL
jgi:phosphatidylglycerol---prolipoprotein diacylglyceryl transferase